MTTKQIRKKLSSESFCEDEEKLKNALKLRGEDYKPKHTPLQYLKFLKFLREGGFNFDETPNSPNHPYAYQFFSCESQHVMGDSLEECLDKAIRLVRSGKYGYEE